MSKSTYQEKVCAQPRAKDNGNGQQRVQQLLSTGEVANSFKLAEDVGEDDQLALGAFMLYG